MVEECLEQEEKKNDVINEAVDKVMSKMPKLYKREIQRNYAFPFSSVEEKDDWKDTIAKCTDEYGIEAQWFMDGPEDCNITGSAKR